MPDTLTWLSISHHDAGRLIRGLVVCPDCMGAVVAAFKSPVAVHRISVPQERDCDLCAILAVINAPEADV